MNKHCGLQNYKCENRYLYERLGWYWSQLTHALYDTDIE